MKQVEDFCTQLSEAVFGHVSTREEKMAAIRTNLEKIIRQAEDDLVGLELKLEDAEIERKKAARKGDLRAMRRAARKTVLTSRERERLEDRVQQTTRELQQMTELEGDQVLLDSKLQMISLVNQARPLPNLQAMQQQLQLYDYNMQQSKMMNEMMRDAMNDAQASDEESAELSANGEAEVQRLCQHSRDLVNQKKFSDMPKPRGSHISSIVLKESTVEMKQHNREEKQRLESHLRGAT